VRIADISKMIFAIYFLMKSICHPTDIATKYIKVMELTLLRSLRNKR
jgi:hypothetical protein